MYDLIVLRIAAARTTHTTTGCLNVKEANIRVVLPRVDMAQSSRCPPDMTMFGLGTGRSSPRHPHPRHHQQQGAAAAEFASAAAAVLVAPQFYTDAQHVYVLRLSSVAVTLSSNRRIAVELDGLTNFVHPLCAAVLVQLLDSVADQKRRCVDGWMKSCCCVCLCL